MKRINLFFIQFPNFFFFQSLQNKISVTGKYIYIYIHTQIQTGERHRLVGGAVGQTVLADGSPQRGASHLLHGRRQEAHPGRARGRRLVRRIQLQNVQGNAGFLFIYNVRD